MTPDSSPTCSKCWMFERSLEKALSWYYVRRRGGITRPWRRTEPVFFREKALADTGSKVLALTLYKNFHLRVVNIIFPMPWSEAVSVPTVRYNCPPVVITRAIKGLIGRARTFVTANKPLTDVWRGPQPPRLVNLIWGWWCQLAVKRRIFAAEPVH